MMLPADPQADEFDRMIILDEEVHGEASSGAGQLAGVPSAAAAARKKRDRAKGRKNGSYAAKEGCTCGEVRRFETARARRVAAGGNGRGDRPRCRASCTRGAALLLRGKRPRL